MEQGIESISTAQLHTLPGPAPAPPSNLPHTPLPHTCTDMKPSAVYTSDPRGLAPRYETTEPLAGTPPPPPAGPSAAAAGSGAPSSDGISAAAIGGAALSCRISIADAASPSGGTSAPTAGISPSCGISRYSAQTRLQVPTSCRAWLMRGGASCMGRRLCKDPAVKVGSRVLISTTCTPNNFWPHFRAKGNPHFDGA